MSGGVDSAVAALLCARAGGDAVAVTLELWADEENDAEASCCSAHAVRVARSLAHGMGLPHFTLDLREEFRAGVVTPWLDEHAAGLTPNPCVRCNGNVRLDAMLDFAGRLGAGALATGHYARRSADGLLRSAADPAKDQAYMLCALAPATIARMRFPLGELTKPEVRALAAEAELPVASKADSQDLCFLAGTGRAAFLARHGGARERAGEIVDRGGRVLGRHRGHHGFTVGQRKGIGIAAPEPLYVLATDARANTRDRRGAQRPAHARGGGARRAAAPPGGRGRRGAAALSLAPAAVRGGGAGARAGRRCAWASRSTARRRGRPLVCTRAMWWWGTGRSRRARGERQRRLGGSGCGAPRRRRMSPRPRHARSRRHSWSGIATNVTSVGPQPIELTLLGAAALRTTPPTQPQLTFGRALDPARAPGRAAPRARHSARTPCRPRRARHSRGAA